MKALLLHYVTPGQAKYGARVTAARCGAKIGIDYVRAATTDPKKVTCSRCAKALASRGPRC